MTKEIEWRDDSARGFSATGSLPGLYIAVMHPDPSVGRLDFSAYVSTDKIGDFADLEAAKAAAIRSASDMVTRWYRTLGLDEGFYKVMAQRDSENIERRRYEAAIVRIARNDDQFTNIEDVIDVARDALPVDHPDLKDRDLDDG